MTLSTQTNPKKVLAASQEHARRHGRTAVHTLIQREEGADLPHPDYGTTALPKYRIPSHGTDGDTAYSLISNELTLDGSPTLNLASFVHTHMDDYATRICTENIAKNLIDSDEYPATTLIHTRTVSMLAALWHADESEEATGTATTGSSEAIQLGGLAMKKRWQEKMRAAGKDEYRPGPNIVMGANAQVALEKFARYFDVEMRLVPVDASTKYVMDPKRAMEYVDENTIGVFVILGSTYTGTYEDVAGMCKVLDEYEAKTGISVPVHVDAASGGFVAPFASPKLVWDFKLPRVVSINTSAHKYGQVFVGCGMVVWRDKAHLPKDLVFELHYLGSIEYSFSLNFSRPAHPILALYYNLIKLGFDGYRKISLRNASNARLLARALENSTYFDVVSEVHHPAIEPESASGATDTSSEPSLLDKAAEAVAGTLKHHGVHRHRGGPLEDDIEFYKPSLPVVAFKFNSTFKQEYPNVKQKWIQTLLRSKSWIVPNYDLPPNAENEEVLRVVIRENFSEELVERLIYDIIEVVETLMKEAKDTLQPAGTSSSATQAKDDSRPRDGSERQAAKHGEGVRPTGHDSVC